MAQPDGASGGVAQVDFLVDEKGARIPVEEDSTLRTTTDIEQAVGGTGPSNWWRLGLIAVGAVALVLLVMQVFSGGARTDVVPGTPTVQTQN